MSTSFLVSDTHFGHENTWAKFKLRDGVTPLRPFSSTEEMDEAMVERWNSVVKPGDKVYHLGDVIINKKHLQTVSRLNGKKRLIRGNHDIMKDSDYRNVGFEQIWGVRVFVDKFILSHIPLHPDSVTHRFKVNVHGHTHGDQVMWKDGTEYDPRYLCVCVEHTNFTPISFEEAEERIKKRWEDSNYEGASGWFNGSGPG